LASHEFNGDLLVVNHVNTYYRMGKKKKKKKKKQENKKQG